MEVTLNCALTAIEGHFHWFLISNIFSVPRFLLFSAFLPVYTKSTILKTSSLNFSSGESTSFLILNRVYRRILFLWRLLSVVRISYCRSLWFWFDRNILHLYKPVIYIKRITAVFSGNPIDGWFCCPMVYKSLCALLVHWSVPRFLFCICIIAQLFEEFNWYFMQSL